MQPVAWQGFDFHDGLEAPVHCWGRVQLPHEQVTHTLWKEVDHPNAWCTCNIKFYEDSGQFFFAEVQFFFQLKTQSQSSKETEHCLETLALVSQYSKPNHQLLNLSHHTVCHFLSQMSQTDSSLLRNLNWMWQIWQDTWRMYLILVVEMSLMQSYIHQMKCTLFPNKHPGDNGSQFPVQLQFDLRGSEPLSPQAGPLIPHWNAQSQSPLGRDSFEDHASAYNNHLLNCLNNPRPQSRNSHQGQIIPTVSSSSLPSLTSTVTPVDLAADIPLSEEDYKGIIKYWNKITWLKTKPKPLNPTEVSSRTASKEAEDNLGSSSSLVAVGITFDTHTSHTVTAVGMAMDALCVADLCLSLNLNSTVSGLSEPSHAMAPKPSSSCHPNLSSNIDTSCHLGNNINDPGPIAMADGGSSAAKMGKGTSIMHPNKTSTIARNLCALNWCADMKQKKQRAFVKDIETYWNDLIKNPMQYQFWKDQSTTTSSTKPKTD
ncbi:hypothetical protein DFH29DRAFT_875607 [Suillus ampliporus]|nr:hypothetical protein DFH29DRAFT_875607 [Suillus ampliporus]